LIGPNIYTELLSIVYSTIAVSVSVNALVKARAAQREAKAAKTDAKTFKESSEINANRACLAAESAERILSNTAGVAKIAACSSIDSQAAAVEARQHSAIARDHAEKAEASTKQIVTVTPTIAKGHAECGACHRVVARYEVSPTKGVVCANCKE